MPYIGNTIRAADDYRLIDDISSGFNGSETSFALQVAGSAPVPFPKSPQQVLISVNGVIQEPDPTGSSGFNLVGTNIVFSSAPTNGHAFFGIIYATADYLNAGGNFPAGSLGAPSITFIGDENTGLFRKSGGSVGFVSDATEIANFDSNGITISSGNIIIPDSIIHNGDTNTKIRFPSADTITAETGGSERVRVDSSGNVGIATTSGGGKLAILSNSSTYEGLELQTPSGDGSGEFHIGVHQSGTTSGRTIVFKRGGADGMDTESMRIDSSGNVGIGTASPDGKLSVTGNIVCNSGNIRCNGSFSSDVNLTLTADENNNAGNAIIFKESTSEKMRITSIGNVLVGASSSIEVASSAEAQMQITQASDGSRLGLALISIFNGSGPAAVLALGHGRGSTSGVLQDNDSVGQIRFAGGDGTDCQTHAASINCEIDGTPSGNVMPGALFFNTNPGAGSTIERMRINSSGNVLIGRADTTGIPSSGNELVVSSSGNMGITIQSTDSNYSNLYYVDSAGGNAAGYVSYQHSIDSLQFATATNERMRIDNSGKVGIGTTSPDETLHVHKGSAGSVSSHVRSVLTLENDAAAHLQFLTPNNNANQINFGDPQRSVAGYINYNHANNALTFGTTDASERMRITSTGFVGIGTTTPNSLFEVNKSSGTAYDATSDSAQRDVGATIAVNNGSGTANSFAQIVFDNADTNQSIARIVAIRRSTSSTHLAFVTEHGNTKAERLRISSDGFIGCGGGTHASEPRGQFVINSEKNALANANPNDPHHYHLCLKNDNDTNGEAIGFAFSCSSTIDRVGAAIIHKRLGAGSVGDMRFYTCRTEGTTSLGAFISKNQEFRLGPDENNAIAVTTDPVHSIGTPGFSLNTNNLARLVIQERTGDWISFKDGSGTHYGTISRSGSGITYGNNSDYRLKDNVADLTGGITLLKQLRPVTFNWNDLSGLSKTETHQGFIAHEVQALVPDAVSGEKDGMDIYGNCTDSEGNITQEHVAESKKAEGETWVKVGENIKDQQLDTSKLIPILTQALKEAVTEIETLKTKVAALEAA